jgi:hypothetical protein
MSGIITLGIGAGGNIPQFVTTGLLGSVSYTLVIQDSTHAHAADNLTLTQHNVLVIQDAAHTHTADNLDLVQHNVLAIQDGAHAHTADNLTLTAHAPGVVVLEIQDALHSHTADNVVLVTSVTTPTGATGAGRWMPHILPPELDYKEEEEWIILQ